MNTVDPALWQVLYEYSMAKYPEEACGLIIDGYIDNYVVHGEFVPISNVSQTPTSTYKMSKSEFEKYIGRVTAVFHSHPDAPPCPSAADMRDQIKQGVPYIIVSTNGSNCQVPFAFGDQLGILPLENRVFRHGVTDCYSAIRDIYRTKGEVLPEFPRDWEWWVDSNEDFYGSRFPEAGFRKIRADSPEEIARILQPGDVLAICMRSKVPNHGAVYLGDGLIYHHLGSERGGPYAPGNRSVIEPGMRWLDFRPIVLRFEKYENHQASWAPGG